MPDEAGAARVTAAINPSNCRRFGGSGDAGGGDETAVPTGSVAVDCTTGNGSSGSDRSSSLSSWLLEDENSNVDVVYRNGQ